MELTSHHFAEGARRALDDEVLQDALGKATSRFREERKDAFEGFPEGEALRDYARAVKERTLAQLDSYLLQLSESVERLGGQVHWAEDAAEACQIITQLAKDADARSVVKSKSMTTEEIELNDALEEAGMSVVETDLGEYIVQLAGEAPSHIIAPAIHKTKEEVADLFVEKIGSPRLERHEDLVAEARRHLRETFRQADVGITGVNFAVAETGTLVVVENEGNARLVSSLPRTHIAVMGMEKVIPSLQDLSVFLRILARSATGQRASSYVSLCTGPKKAGERDGPEEFHLVVLDNGRSRLLADPQLRESLCCIRCGACLNACPVYRHAGGHAYGWVYSGPIGAVIAPTLIGHQEAAPLPFASSLCGACREVCPVRIDLPSLLLRQRQQVVESQTARGSNQRRLERLGLGFYRWLASSPWRFATAGRWLYLLSRPWARGRRWWRPPGFEAWTAARDVPAPARRSFRQLWRQERRDRG